MALSWLLLCVFVLQWLAIRYNAERDILQKELDRQFTDAKSQVMDSTLIINLIEPMIKDQQHFKVTVRNSDSSILYRDNPENPETITQNCQPPGKRALTYRINISDSTVKKHMQINRKGRFYTDSGNIALHSIRLIVGQAIDSGQNQSSIRQFLPAETDTALFRKIFAEKMRKQDQAFTIKWISGQRVNSASQPGQGSAIFLSGKVFEGSLDVAVERFSWYLIKKIIPQILFAVILLVLTGTAFLFTYRSLKKQVLLHDLRNDFISNISHELKTPVATVKVALESLRNFDMKKDPAVVNDYLDMASQEMNRLDRLISKVMSMSVPEGNNSMATLVNADLRSLTLRTIRSMTPQIEEQQAEVSVEAPDEQYLCPMDELLIEGVLLNLIDNSLKYAGKKSWIGIRLSQDQTRVTLTVSDHGPGIPPQYISKVFDKFFRVPTGDRHNVKGHGLGLSYAAQVMKQHRGTISVRNPEDGGCEFTLTIPKI